MKQKSTVVTLPDKNGKPLYVFMLHQDYLSLLTQVKEAREKLKEAKEKSEPSIKSALSIKRNAGNVPDDVIKRAQKFNISLIRAWREHFGLTQVELSRRMNIAQASLAIIEKKGNHPRATTLEKIAHALGINAMQLI